MKTIVTNIMKTTLTALLFTITLNVYSHDVYVWVELENKKGLNTKQSEGIPDGDTSLTTKQVEMLAFSAEKENSTVKLDWQTGFEINNDYFVIERSTDISVWENIGSLPGSGNSSYPLSYSFIDEKPINGISYYRISQIDYNGIVTYSKTVAIEIYNQPSDIKLFPQPSTSQVQVTLDDYGGDDINISILSPRGILIRKIRSNTASTYLDISDLNQGVYFIKVEGIRQRPQMVKMIKN